ncbi:MAG: type III-A CRISPR-associated protein Cas10/Csm1 [Paludibacteraceae bacterium]
MSEQKPLLFVGGDLSGIQKFIYNITSKRAMVSLKGRSLYLKEYTEDVCKKILDSPTLQNSGMSKEKMKIYCSGGKFYLQLPDSEEVKTSILEIRKKAVKDLWNKHKGQLSINIDFVPFVYEGDKVKVDGETDNIGLLWTKITEKFNALKNQKFKSLLIEDDLFEVQKVGGDVKVCQITGIEGAKEYTFKFKDKDGEKQDVLTILPSVKEQIDLGLKLRDKQYFKMLEEYADGTYLGVLRMDVDGLGTRFIKGFESMEKYKDFSKKLDEFFDADNGNLHTIQKQYKEHLNIVYAGGDDIFVVGRWDKVIDFANDVRTQFAAYCKEVLNDATLSISGGIAIVNTKYPIAKAAELAGDAEEEAKKYNNGKKNAFCMFGENISWNEEFDYVKSYKEQFVSLIDKCGLSRGILHKIMNYAAMVKENQIIVEENKNGNNKRKPDMSYLWHAAYYLTRFMGKEKDNKVVYAFCKDLRDEQLVKTANYKLVSLAARWAELELREIKDKESINDKNE